MMHSKDKEKSMTFAQQVEYVRKQLYWSRSEMAKEMGVTEQTIYRWEQGLSMPHISSKGRFISLCKKKRINLDNMR